MGASEPADVKARSKAPGLQPNFSIELRQIESYLKTKRYSIATLALNSLIGKVQEYRRQAIADTFPAGTEWKAGPVRPDTNNASFDEPIFFRQFTGKDSAVIEVEVFFSSPSIDEYTHIIKSPAAVEAMENVKIVEINSTVTALEKFVAADGFYERNIVVSPDILVNVVASHITNKQAIDRFVENIDFKKLRTVLEQ